MIDSGVRELLDLALRRFGEAAQWRHLQQECAELIVAISHRLDAAGSMRPKTPEANFDDLVDEVADVAIMIEQAMMMVGPSRVEARIEVKLERLRLWLSAN